MIEDSDRIHRSHRLIRIIPIPIYSSEPKQIQQQLQSQHQQPAPNPFPSIVRRYFDNDNHLTYQTEIETTLTNHIRIFYLKLYFLLDIPHQPLQHNPQRKPQPLQPTSPNKSPKTYPIQSSTSSTRSPSPTRIDFLDLLEDYYVTDLADNIKWSESAT